MYTATWTADGDWEGGVKPFANLEVSPAAQVLNYGQSIFEGMKARRTPDDKIVLFRPDMNAQRFQDGADRLCMPRVPLDMFVDAVKSLAEANKDYVRIPAPYCLVRWSSDQPKNAVPAAALSAMV